MSAICRNLSFILFCFSVNCLFGDITAIEPEIILINPISGSPGDVVTIVATHTCDVAKVEFKGVPATIISMTPTEIIVQVPNLVQQTVKVNLIPTQAAKWLEDKEKRLAEKAKGKKSDKNSSECMCKKEFQPFFVVQGLLSAFISNTGFASPQTGFSSYNFGGNLVPAQATFVTHANAPRVSGPLGIASSPDGSTMYAVNSTQEPNINIIDVFSGFVVNTIKLSKDAGRLQSIAITSDGDYAYVTSQKDGRVYVLDCKGKRKQSPKVIGRFFSSESSEKKSLPTGCAISFDNETLYVINNGDHSLVPFDIKKSKTHPKAGTAAPLPKKGDYRFLALTPKETRAQFPTVYIADSSTATDASHSILYLDLSKPLKPKFIDSIPVGSPVNTIAINGPGNSFVFPGSTLYAAGSTSGNVYSINVATNQLAGSNFQLNIPGAVNLYALCTAGNPRRLFVSDIGVIPGIVYTIAIDTGTGTPSLVQNSNMGFGTVVGNDPKAIACMPNQSPLAGFSVSGTLQVGQPVTFDASTLSASPNSFITNYTWDFGDKTIIVTGPSAIVEHTYITPGQFCVKLVVTNNGGTSTKIIFPTGQEITNNGNPHIASDTQVITILSGPTQKVPSNK